jgi:hypothetical protein
MANNELTKHRNELTMDRNGSTNNIKGQEPSNPLSARVSKDLANKESALRMIYNDAMSHYVMIFPKEYVEGFSFNDYTKAGIIPIADK